MCMDKTCTKCSTPKDLDQYPRNRASKDGRHSYCKTCMNAQKKARYEANPAVFKARSARTRETQDPEVRRSIQRAWRAANPDKDRAHRNKELRSPALRERQLRTKFGITPADYERMHAAQNGLCAVCKAPPPQGRRYLAVDHNHTTGAVRGLLCDACNTALGLAADSSERLKNLAIYLDTHNPERM